MEAYCLQPAQRLQRRRGVKCVQEDQSPIVVEPSKTSAPVILEQPAGPAVFE